MAVPFYIPRLFQNPTTSHYEETTLIRVDVLSPLDHFNSTVTAASTWCSLPTPSIYFSIQQPEWSWWNEIRVGLLFCLRPYNSFSCYPEKSQIPDHDLDSVPRLWLCFPLLSPSLTPLQLWQQLPWPALHSCRLHICGSLCLERLPTYPIPRLLRTLFKHPSQGGFPSHPTSLPTSSPALFFSLVHYHLLTRHMLYLPYYLSPFTRMQKHPEGRDLCLFCSLLNPQCLE